MFPFSFEGDKFWSCTEAYRENREAEKRWCAIQVDSNGVVHSHNWEDCSDECIVRENLEVGKNLINQSADILRQIIEFGKAWENAKKT